MYEKNKKTKGDSSAVYEKDNQKIIKNGITFFKIILVAMFVK